MDVLLKIAGMLIMTAGAVMVFAAKPVSKTMGLAEKQVIRLDADDETIEKLKEQKAIMKVKLVGGAVFLPGMALILYLFR